MSDCEVIAEDNSLTLDFVQNLVLICEVLNLMSLTQTLIFIFHEFFGLMLLFFIGRPLFIFNHTLVEMEVLNFRLIVIVIIVRLELFITVLVVLIFKLQIESHLILSLRLMFF